MSLGIWKQNNLENFLNFKRAVEFKIIEDDLIQITQADFVCCFCGSIAIFEFMNLSVCEKCQSEIKEV